MSGKENKHTSNLLSTCSKLGSVSRRSITSPFNGANKKPASSGVRLPCPARRSITIPLIPSTPTRSTATQLRSSLVNQNGILKDEHNIQKTIKYSIQPEAVIKDKLALMKPVLKKPEPSVKSNKAQPLKSQPILAVVGNGQNVQSSVIKRTENTTETRIPDRSKIQPPEIKFATSTNSNSAVT